MINNVTEFKIKLAERGFSLSEVLQKFSLTPNLYKNLNKDMILSGNIHVCIYGGSDTPENELGCVTFALNAKMRHYKCRKVEQVELFKHAFVATSYEHALMVYGTWSCMMGTEMRKWKKIM